MEHLFWPALNLFGLLGFIAYKTRGPFFSFVRSRRDQITDGLNRSKIQIESASRRKAEVEAKLSSLESEVAAILSDWRKKTEQKSAAIRDASVRVLGQMTAEAELNRKSLVEQTSKSIERSFRRAITQAAETKIRQSLNDGVHQQVNLSLVREVSNGGRQA